MVRIAREMTASKKSAGLHAHSDAESMRMLSMKSSHLLLQERLPIHTVTEHFFVEESGGVQPAAQNARSTVTMPGTSAVPHPSDSAHCPYQGWAEAGVRSAASRPRSERMVRRRIVERVRRCGGGGRYSSWLRIDMERTTPYQQRHHGQT